MTDTDAAGPMNFLFEVGMLKRARRTGWRIAGVNDSASIAGHSFRTAIAGTVPAAMQGLDPARVALMCVLHDSGTPWCGRSTVATIRLIRESSTWCSAPSSMPEAWDSTLTPTSASSPGISGSGPDQEMTDPDFAETLAEMPTLAWWFDLTV
jgi:hypothetical protein